MEDIWTKELFDFGTGIIRAGDLITLFLIIFGTTVFLMIVKRLIRRKTSTKKIDSGRSMAVYQIVKYFVIVIAIVISLDVIGVKVTVLLAGSAALLVGVGLGVQQLFNDLVSGIVLLVEGTVSVGDIVEIDGVVGKIQEINLRTSQLLTREGISILVPNSKLVGDNVINWSHNRQSTRFSVEVGVAYGSDIALVIKLIRQAADEHKIVERTPEPGVRFVDFGNSSLDFKLNFWSQEMWIIEDVKSEIRIAIEQKFRDNNVTIPFPQRDLHLKTSFKNLDEIR